ncbi:MAG: hypothetical protein JW927_20455 [Deltaproteobacteria bacterium]|nr:hypothetical protein [Deltaproteobacteria bacterium]
MIYHEATLADCLSLAELNHQLIHDEGHRNPLVPRYEKCLDIAHDSGIPVFYYNCGKCEKLIPSMVEISVAVCDPDQSKNYYK